MGHLLNPFGFRVNASQKVNQTFKVIILYNLFYRRGYINGTLLVGLAAGILFATNRALIVRHITRLGEFHPFKWRHTSLLFRTNILKPEIDGLYKLPVFSWRYISIILPVIRTWPICILHIVVIRSKFEDNERYCF